MAQSHTYQAFNDLSTPLSTSTLSHKHSGKAAYMPIDSQMRLDSDPDSYVSSPALHDLQTVKRIQRFNNIFSQILGLCSVTLTVGMDGILFYVLYKFYTTRSISAPNANPPRTSPWSNDTQLWPAFVLLISSTLTFVIDLIALIASCYSRRTRRAAEKVENAMTTAGYIAFVLKWIAVAVLYRVGKTTKDLWGWSCDERAQRIQQFYASELNFSKLCVEQTYAWYLSIAEWVLKVILMCVALVLAWKVKKHNRKN